MTKSKRVQATVSLCLLFFSAMLSAESISTFDDLLIRELENRATARVLMAKMANVRESKADGIFWRAYSRLEELNYKVFKNGADEFGFSVEPRWKSRFLAATSSVALRIMPQFILESVHKSTIEYVSQLEELYRLSPPSHNAFFEYVVRQEKAQVEAITHAVNKNYHLAAEVLNDFVAKNKASWSSAKG